MTKVVFNYSDLYKSYFKFFCEREDFAVMLKNISLSKFKAFSELKSLEIKPLTILCGVNSGGKSSILKSLLLLKQSYENASSSNEATLNGPYTTNGLMKDVLHYGKGTSFSISNVFNVKFQGSKFVKNSKQDVSTAKELGKITNLAPNQVASFSIDVMCSIKKGIVSDLWDTNFIEYFVITISPISMSGKKIESEEFTIQMQYRSGGKGKYDITLKNFPTISNKKENCTLENCMCYFSGMRLTNLFYETDKKIKGPVFLNDFLTNIYSVFRIAAEQYSGIKYLGPLRENPKRQYAISNDYFSTSSTGADTPFLLAKDQGKKVNTDLYPPAVEVCYEKKAAPNKQTLFELVQMWMDYFELGCLDMQTQQDSLQVNIKNSNIADVGFGVSQILPVIVHGLAMDFEQTMILEQPEIHLHPRMQMRMADFLLSLSQTNHGVIVETHSDHIINRLVRRILESDNANLIDNVAIYFVENASEGSRISKIEVNRVSGISDSPKEFFSQFASETSYIVKAGINNMRKGD